MNLYASTFLIGDMIFQLLMFLLLIAIPAVIIILFFVLNKRKKRLERIEEKVDRLLSDRDQ